MFETLKALRAGEVVDLNGVMLRKADGEIRPGDLYVADGNTGPRLLTCQTVKGAPEPGNPYYGWIVSTTREYSYDIGHCVRVEEA